jgi:uncharacterized metal-binding protein
MTRKIPVVACSGIGKALGAAAREAAYVLAEDLRPEASKVVALGLLVLGNDETGKQVAGGPAIAFDGCKLGCAAKGLECAGASEIRKVAVFDVLRRLRGLKPEGICDLNADGLALARASADEGAAIVDELVAGNGHA